MAKFSLLTILTLNASGYKSGIDDAKASTKQLTNGCNQATEAISNSFGSIAGLGSSAVAPVMGLVSAVKSGVMAWWSMVPAINGVSVALIATGVGAIVVGLGLAFGALTSYLTGTSEGANKLKLIMAGIGGVISTILQRIKLFGSSMSNLLSGNWAKMADDFNAAFAGGFLDEAKKNAQDTIANTEAEIALNGKKRKLLTEEADAKKEIAEMDYKARNMDEETKEGAAAKLGYVKKEIELTAKLFKDKQDIADSEIAIEASKQKSKYGANYTTLALSEDKTKLAEFQAHRIDLETEFINFKTGKQKLVGKLQKQLNTENNANVQAQIDADKKIQDDLAENVQAQIDSEKRIQDLKNIDTDIELSNDVKTATSKKEKSLAEIELFRTNQQKKIDAIKVTNAEEVIQQTITQNKLNEIVKGKKDKVETDSTADDSSENIKDNKFDSSIKAQLLKSSFAAGIISLKSYQQQQSDITKQNNANELAELDNQLTRKEISEKDYAKKKKQILAQQAADEDANNKKKVKLTELCETKKAEAIGSAAGAAAAASKELFGEQSMAYKAFAITQAGIATYLAATKALAEEPAPLNFIMAASITAMGLANVAKIAAYANGGIVGGSSFNGDKVHAMVNSGEMILNQNQQKNLFGMANGNVANNSLSWGNVRFEIEGTKLVGVLNNNARKNKNMR